MVFVVLKFNSSLKGLVNEEKKANAVLWKESFKSHFEKQTRSPPYALVRTR